MHVLADLCATSVSLCLGGESPASSAARANAVRRGGTTETLRHRECTEGRESEPSQVPIGNNARAILVTRGVVRLFALIVAISLTAPAGAASRFFADRAGAPVRWETWGNHAFERAKREKRPVFVHIGFASSYECYRMHREAFLNGENAEMLNAHFVPVILDRVEHPEVAERYENGAREWPVNLVLDATGEPVARAGFMKSDELSRFLVIEANRWSGGSALVLSLEKKPTPAAPFDIETIVDAIAKAQSDTTTPRRPRPMTISFLLRYAARMKHEGIRGVAVEMLRTLASSPIHDQLGGGFHRASRDADWGDPYFEKLLPDQALLSMSYLEAWQATGDPAFASVSRSTIEHVLRDLRGGGKGPFDASQDAYNFVPLQGPELVNGDFYRWGIAEAAKVPPDEKEDARTARIASVLDRRQKRPQPSREFNVIAGWNGLMISALSRAGAAFGERRYLEAATSAARTLTITHWNAKTKTLLRSEGNPALSEDYAFLVQGLLDLFDAGQDVQWLELAIALQQRHDELFWDPNTGAYSRGTFHEDDGETPAASSVAALNLLRLATLTGNEIWRARPAVIFQAFGGRALADGASYASLGTVYELSLIPPRIVVITGDVGKEETREVLQSYHQRAEPMRALIFVHPKGIARDRVVRVLPFIRALTADPEKPRVYECANGECHLR